MLSCSTVCPNCKHQFTCCPTTNSSPPSCCLSTTTQRSIQFLSGGGLVTTTTTTTSAITPTSPQISPSVPLSFILPSPNGIETAALQLQQQQQPYQQQQSERELEKLTDIVRVLRLSGWYYENITFNKSDELLKCTRIGTFLLRNSSDSRYLFSLSMQTERGPKSVRLYYINGYFRLDAEQHLQNFMPLFSGVIELIQYYRCNNKRSIIHNNNNNNNDGHRQVWISPNGKRSSICLEQPLYKDRKPPTLKHLTRLTINRHVTDRRKLAFLELPPSLTQYMEEYPYSI